MRYSNHKIAYQPSQTAYPELHPVTERQYRRKAVQSQQKKHLSRGESIFYLVINAALIFGILQCGRTLIGDSLNLSTLLKSQASVQQYFQAARHENRLLSQKIKIYSSPSGIEELARNYLNMVGQNELPIRFQ